MADVSSHNINQKIDIENKININRFNISLLYIFIINNINSFKNIILKRKEEVFFFQKENESFKAKNK